jgi:hypothetical protein
MNKELLILYVILNIANVIVQTIKTLATVNCGKTVASLVNSVAYGLYTVVVVYTVCDLPLWFKVAVVAVANLIGVYVVKVFEEKIRKDKLWKVEATVYEPYTESLHEDLKKASLPHSYIENVGKYTVFNIYCETQADSLKAKEILYRNKAKYFVSENKGL